MAIRKTKNKKMRMMQILSIWMIVLVINITMAHALAINFDPQEDILVDRNSASIAWNTDEESQGIIDYGPAENLPTFSEQLSDPNFVQNHQVALTDLAYDTEYGFRITAVGAGEDGLVTDDNNGAFYRFSTGRDPLPGRVSPAADPVPVEPEEQEQDPEEPPQALDEDDDLLLLPSRDAGTPFRPADDAGEQVIFIEADIPAYAKSSTLTIRGQTLPGATIKVYANVDPSVAEEGRPGHGGLAIARADGGFTTYISGLGEENIIIIHAESDEQTATKNFEVHIDSTAPIVEANIPGFTGDDHLEVTGSVDEQVTVIYEVRYPGDDLEPTVGELTQTAGDFALSIPVGLPSAAQDGAIDEEEIDASPGNQLTPQQAEHERTLPRVVDLTLTFEDGAGNSKKFTEQIKIFPTPPRILQHNLDQLSPSYVQKVTIRGKATPGATVIAVVNGEASSHGAWSTSLLDNIMALGVRFTPGRENYNVEVGESGEFEIDVLLSKKMRENQREHLPAYYDVSSNEGGAGFGSHLGETNSGEYENQIELIAIDDMSEFDPQRYDKAGPSPVTFAQCGSGSFWQIKASPATPNVILPEHLRRGYAMLGVDLAFKWVGPGQQGIMVEPPKVRVIPLSPAAQEEYTYDPQTLVRKPILTKFGSDYESGGLLIQFNPVDYEQEALGDIDITEDLLVEIPLELELRFKYSQGGREVERSQRNCIDVSTQLDVEFPSDAIPKDLLNGSINFIDATTDVIDAILKPLKKISIFLFVGCLLSWVFLAVRYVDEKVECIGMSGEEQNKDDDCKDAKHERREFEKKMKWLCDRTFCPSAPTLEKYTHDVLQRNSRDPDGKLDNDAYDSVCRQQTGTPEAETGYPSMRAAYANYEGINEGFMSGYKTAAAAAGETPSCAQEYLNQWGSACLGMNEFEESGCMYYQRNGETPPDNLKCSNPILNAVSKSFCKAEDVKKAGTIVHWSKRQGHCDAQGRRIALTAGETENERWFRLKKLGTEFIWEEVDMAKKAVRVEGDPNRYDLSTSEAVSLRDLTPALEQKYCLSTEAKPEETVIDPTAGLISSLRCGCVPAFSGYLQLWKNILGVGKACFQEILRTGKPDAGMCRAVLTRYLCDVAFDAIRCFGQRFGAGTGATTDGAGREGVSGFLDGIYGAGNAVQNSVANRYGKSALYDTLLNKKTLVHSACLWAFTGDFDFDLEGALTGAGAVPIQSECFVTPATRRFMTSNPVNRGLATFMYHIGVGIAAGADLNYHAELICSDATGCDPERFPGGKCDCYQRGEQVTEITGQIGPGFSAAGDIAQADIYYPAVETPYRYDTIKVYYDYRNNDGQTQRVTCYDEKLEGIGAQPLGTCGFDVAGGFYHCEVSAGDRGYAAFIRKPTPLKSFFKINDRIEVNVEVEKRSPNFNNQDFNNNRFLGGPLAPASSPTLTAGNPQNQVPFFLSYRLRDQSGRIIKETGPAGSGRGTSLGKDIIPLRQDGSLSLTLPKTLITPEMVGDSFTGGERGRLFDALSYNNDKLKNAKPTEMRWESVSRFESPTPAYTGDVQFGLLLFKDAAGKVCYAMEQASKQPNTQGSQTVLLPGDYVIQSTTAQGDAPCTSEFNNVNLPPPQKNYLRGKVFRYDGKKGIQYFNTGIKVFPNTGILSRNKLYGGALVYEAPQTNKGFQLNDCTPQNPQRWKLELELLYCKQDPSLTAGSSAVLGSGVDTGGICRAGSPEATSGRCKPAVPISAENCNLPSEQVVSFNGKAQSYVGAEAIEIPIVCREATQPGQLNNCPTNALLTGSCNCGDAICGEGSAGNMCHLKNGRTQCIQYQACTRYETTRNPVNPVNEVNSCDCDGLIGYGQTDMECSVGNYCVRCPNQPDQAVCVPPERRNNPPNCHDIKEQLPSVVPVPGLDASEVFRFAVMGDSSISLVTSKETGFGDFEAPEKRKLGKHASKAANKLKDLLDRNVISFVVHNGNMINGGKFGTYSPTYHVEDPGVMWGLYKTTMLNTINAHGNKVVPVPGWRDVTPETPFRDAYATFWNDPANKPTLTFDHHDSDNYPFNYAFVKGKSYFVVLDTTEGTLKNGAWLQDKFRRGKKFGATHIFVFSNSGMVPVAVDEYTEFINPEPFGASPGLGHERAHDETYQHATPPRLEGSNADALLNILKNKPTTLFTDNEGVYVKGTYKNVQVVSVGAVGDAQYAKNIRDFVANDPHPAFVMVDVKGSSVGVSQLSVPNLNADFTDTAEVNPVDLNIPGFTHSSLEQTASNPTKASKGATSASSGSSAAAAPASTTPSTRSGSIAIIGTSHIVSMKNYYSRPPLDPGLLVFEDDDPNNSDKMGCAKEANGCDDIAYSGRNLVGMKAELNKINIELASRGIDKVIVWEATNTLGSSETRLRNLLTDISSSFGNAGKKVCIAETPNGVVGDSKYPHVTQAKVDAYNHIKKELFDDGVFDCFVASKNVAWNGGKLHGATRATYDELYDLFIAAHGGVPVGS